MAGNKQHLKHNLELCGLEKKKVPCVPQALGVVLLNDKTLPNVFVGFQLNTNASC